MNPSGKVLLGKRKNGYGAGYYGMPGGHVELGEPLHAAALRELQEETAVVATQLEFLGVVRENQRNIDFIHFIYVLRNSSSTPQLAEPDKCEGWEWKNLDKAENILPGHQRAFELLRRSGEAPAVIDVPKEIA
jgi:8-oxo-dGTP diphosphatase